MTTQFFSPAERLYHAHKAFIPRNSKRDLSHLWRQRYLAYAKLNPLNRKPSNLNDL